MARGQLTVRVGTQLDSEISYLAARLNVNQSEIVRSCLEKGLDEWRQRAADAEQRTGGVKEEEIQAALEELVLAMNANKEVILTPREYTTAKGIALRFLLEVAARGPLPEYLGNIAGAPTTEPAKTPTKPVRPKRRKGT